MDQRTESIKQDIDATREAMTDKMEQIESRVKGTVEDLKGSVEDTVESVKQAFDLRQQVDQRPWTMLGASVLTGYVLGSLGGSNTPRSIESLPYYAQPDGESVRSPYESAGYSSSKREEREDYMHSQPASYPGASSSTATSSRNSYPADQRRSEPGFIDGIMDQFGDELETLKSAALVTVGNLLRDMLKKNLPEFAEEFERARKERERQNEQAAGVLADTSHDPLERAVGEDTDAAFQTHTAAPASKASMPNRTASSSVSGTERNRTYR